MHAGVRNVRRHPLDRSAPANLQKTLVAHRVQLQQRRAVLKTLRPLGPATRGVSAFDGEHRSPEFRLPGFFDGENFLPGKLEDALDFGNEFLRRELVVRSEVYLPLTVNTGVPSSGFQVFSMVRIFCPESSKTRSILGTSFCGVSWLSILIGISLIC